MPFDQHKNLAISRVIAPPSPADIGTAVDIVPGHEVRFPAPPFNVTIWPPSAIPDPVNAEVARVTLIQANRLFIERAQEGTTARSVLIGDFIAETITAKALLDIESGTNFPLITTPGPITSGDSVTAPVGEFGNLGSTPITAHATQHEVGGSDPIDGALSLTTLATSGGITVGTNLVAPNGSVTGLYLVANSNALFTNKWAITSPGVNGTMLLTNAEQADFSLLQFGGTTNQFPALQRNGNGLNLLVADLSNWAPLKAASVETITGPIVTLGSPIWSGTGSPEGVTGAPIGALFLRRDGGIGTTLYVKQSGAATATGWLPVANVGAAPSLHAPTHAAGGTDPVTVTGLAGYPGGTGTYLRADGTFAALPVGQQPGLHAPTHAIGGSDPVVKTFRQGHTWALVGDVSAITILPYAFVPVVGTQTVRIVGVRAVIYNGTSITAQLGRNGSAAGSPIVVTPTTAETAFNIPLANNDALNFALSAPVSAPTHLTLTVILEHTV